LRTATIVTNLRCNLACGFCNARAADDDPVRHGDEVVRARIAKALAEEVQVLVLSGGEPLLRPELEGWIALAAGRCRLVVETNGTLLSVQDRAASLASAGLNAVRVAWNDHGAAGDRLARLPGAGRWLHRGLAAARQSGLEVEISVALGAANLQRVADLPALVQQWVPEASALVLRVISEAPAEHLASWPALADAATRLAVACEATELTLRMDPHHALPWCALPHRRRHAQLLAPPPGLSAERGERIEACDHCAVASLCPGLPRAHLARFGADELVAVSPRDSRLIGSLSEDRGQRAVEFIADDQWFGEGDGRLQLERVLRPVMHCNQDCAFCFVDRELPAPDPLRIRAEIERAARDDVALLALSGGEPTLDPHLFEHISLARSLGLRVRLQTNALRCAEPEFATRLAEAGLQEAFVSLHAADAGRSDAITNAPDTHRRTLAGIDALVAAGIAVQANCVITGSNADALLPMVRLLAERWPGSVRLNLSWAHASSELVPRSAQITPRFGDVRAEIGAAIAACSELGVAFRGLDGQCGLPLCLPEPDWLDGGSLPILPPDSFREGFIKVEACDQCALNHRCVGLREGYAELHGTGELQPVSALPPGLNAEGG